MINLFEGIKIKTKDEYMWESDGDLHVSKSKPKHWDTRFSSDLDLKLYTRLSGRIRETLKNQKAKKSMKTNELLGCDISFFKKHMESRFTEGMTWENYGLYGWHIDHVRPCVSFNLKSKKQQQECFCYKNLQPLWAKDNLSKNDNLSWNKIDKYEDVNFSSIESQLEEKIILLNKHIKMLERQLAIKETLDISGPDLQESIYGENMKQTNHKVTVTNEEIKKCIEEFKPVGFTFRGDDPYYELTTPDNYIYFLGVGGESDITDEEFNLVYYPLLLQRVIEGINNKPMKQDKPHFRIRMNCDINNQWYEVSHGRVLASGHSYITFMFKNNNSIDQAKTQAIKYILNKI